ncbi:hypothetical protein HDU87_007246 [Geranomyces variabilis]|uniref:Chitosanase n=1 Tax=Geranomyces variabilis TaxID=109894 RepID=A0AAD5TEH5_9FUNG|nr:hypothetical protein HDU87_007246 [Geranomyces variabilis]
MARSPSTNSIPQPPRAAAAVSLLLLLAAASLPALATAAALADCQKSMVQQLTNTFENSQLNFAFDYCSDIGDGRGYTCGVVGFTTSTHDAYDVVNTYVNSGNYSLEFDPYIATLATLNVTGDASTKGLSGFCDAWYAAASNPTFRAVQIAKIDSLYYYPSQNISDTLQLTLPAARGQLYDAAIQHGVEADPDSMPSMVARVPRTPGMTDDAWLEAFLAERKRTLCHPSTPATQKAWCASVTRVNSYEHLTATGQSNFTDAFSPLDNDGKEITIKCDLNVWTNYIPGSKDQGGSGSGSGGMGKGAVIAIVLIVLIVAAVAGFLAYWRLTKGGWPWANQRFKRVIV